MAVRIVTRFSATEEVPAVVEVAADLVVEQAALDVEIDLKTKPAATSAIVNTSAERMVVVMLSVLHHQTFHHAKGLARLEVHALGPQLSVNTATRLSAAILEEVVGAAAADPVAAVVPLEVALEAARVTGSVDMSVRAMEAARLSIAALEVVEVALEAARVPGTVNTTVRAMGAAK